MTTRTEIGWLQKLSLGAASVSIITSCMALIAATIVIASYVLRFLR